MTKKEVTQKMFDMICEFAHDNRYIKYEDYKQLAEAQCMIIEAINMIDKLDI